MKLCATCMVEKPLDSFTRGKRSCRSCVGAKHHARYYAQRLANYRKQKYNLSAAEYAAMLRKQNGVCAICKRPETLRIRGEIRALAVDHNHETGRVRALLCSYCNRAIGLLGDDPERASALARYLRKHKREW